MKTAKKPSACCWRFCWQPRCCRSVLRRRPTPVCSSFDQWNDGKITAVYKDYENDTFNRDCRGFGDTYYTDGDSAPYGRLNWVYG